MVANRISASELQGRGDLRDYARALMGEPVKSRQRYDTYFAPWHTEDHASLQVYADGFKHFATNQHGRHIDLTILAGQAANFDQAYGKVLDYYYGGAAPEPRNNATPKKDTTSAAPGQDWQRNAGQIVEAAQAALWSPAGSVGLDYLHARNLSDDTIRRYELGYRPADWTRPPGYRSAQIVIPWQNASGLYAVQYRNLVGAPKYIYENGSKPTFAAFAPDISGAKDRPLWIVETAFDAMLVSQEAGDLVTALATGSTANRLNVTCNVFSRVILNYDNDPAGHAATESNAPGLPTPFTAAYVPTGKDIGEYAQQGHDLRAWVLEILATELPVTVISSNQDLPGYPGSLPITWRAILNAHYHPSVAPALELWFETIARLGSEFDARVISKKLLQAFGDKFGRYVSSETIRIGMNLVCGQLSRDRPHVFSYQGVKLEELILGRSLDNPTPGPKTTYYELYDLATIRAAILKHVSRLIVEDEMSRAEPIEPINVDLIVALELDYDEIESPASIAAELIERCGQTIASQPGLQATLDTIARRIKQLRRDLDDMTEAPIPSGWRYANRDEYVACCAKAWHISQGGATRAGKPRIAAAIGRSERRVKSALIRAGLKDEQQPTIKIVVKSGADLEALPRWDDTNKAKLAQIVAQSAGEKSRWRTAKLPAASLADFIERENAVGSVVTAHYRPANRQTVERDDQPLNYCYPQPLPKTLAYGVEGGLIGPAELRKPKRAPDQDWPAKSFRATPKPRKEYAERWLCRLLALDTGYKRQSDYITTNESVDPVWHYDPQSAINLLLGKFDDLREAHKTPLQADAITIEAIA